MKLKRKGENWRQLLPRPIVMRDGRVLRTLGNCLDYASNLDEGVQGLPPWQQATRLMYAAATRRGSPLAVVEQFERLLLPENKLVLEPTPEQIAGRPQKQNRPPRR